MDLLKFIDLLQSRNLRLARGDTLGDDLEGSLPKMNLLVQEHQINQIVDDSKNDATASRYSPEDIRSVFDNSRSFAKQAIYASCWYSGEVENAVMWRAYASGNAGGVVLQSTYATLRDNLDSSVYIGKITYLDYHGDEAANLQGNMIAAFTYKRKEFESEREVRIVSLKIGNGQPLSLEIPIDVPRIVESVRVYPGAPYWQRFVLTRLIHRYGFQIKVKASQIDEDPGW